jgi:hypothetical protein
MANVPKNTWYDARGSRAYSHLLSTLFYAVYRYNAGRLGACMVFLARGGQVYPAPGQ